MEKPIIGKQSHNQLWFFILVSFGLCLVLLCSDFLVLNKTDETISPPSLSTRSRIDITDTKQDSPALKDNVTSSDTRKEDEVQEVADQQSINDGKTEDPCSGKYIYIHHLPSRFNDDVLKDCRKLNKWPDMCPSLMNSGLGPKVGKPQGVLSNRNWYETNQFLLEVIFHRRMKQYKCLTNDSWQASAIFVPFYAGLDVGRYLWGYNTTVRDSSAYAVLNWLAKQGEWQRMWGRDHFFLAGRIAWDFRRQTENQSDWGSKLMRLPESMNMTMLSIESTSWSNEFAIPYPTYFHPSSYSDVTRWKKRMRSRKRRYLFSFAGSPRPAMNDSIRGELINQCLASKTTCKFLSCQLGGNKCDNPVEVIKVFRDSTFCLQPSGDSYTRRSTFDSILSGCIPVFFHPYSAYAQYIWYFPMNYSKYSVYIPENEIKDGRVSINEALSRFTKDEVLAMREEVLKLIPKVIYADPRSRLERFEDAFDIAVRRVLGRVEKVRKDMKEGRDASVDFASEGHWNLKLSGIVGDRPLEQFL